MLGKNIPADAPPSYDEVVTPSSSSRPSANSTGNSYLGVPGKSSAHGISSSRRRSMGDETRPLPPGWVRTLDPTSQHQFFVDTTKDPPRSIWIHPYDDDEYLRTLSSAERERIEHESMGRGHPPSKADIMAEHTDDEHDRDNHSPASPSFASSGAYPPLANSSSSELPPRPDGKGKSPLSFARKFKDKVTGTTHEQREAERIRRAEEERRLDAQHQHFRQCMAQAAQTGQPVLLGKDKDGKDVYVEPPSYNQGGYGGGYPGGYGGGQGYGYNPYSSGVYSTPNARYIRPSQPYGRPYGSGFGGGYGMPLALGGGLMGGLLLGDLAFGGFM